MTECITGCCDVGVRLRWERRQPGQAEGPRDRGAEEATEAVGGARPDDQHEEDGNLDEMYYRAEEDSESENTATELQRPRRANRERLKLQA